MTDDDLDRHIRAIIAREGGWVDDPDDSGGPTNHGITLAMWMAYCRATPGMEGREDKETLKWLSPLDPWLWNFYRWYFRTQGVDELIDEFSIPDELVPLVMDMRTLHSPDGCRDILAPSKALRYFRDEFPLWVASRLIAQDRQIYMLLVAERRPKDRKYVRGWMHRALKAIGMWPPKAETREA